MSGLPCLACGKERYSGPKPAHADEFVCRECQRSPAVQMRVLLTGARARGMDFERAYAWAFERVKWPHDTKHRQDWKVVLEGEATVAAYRRGYNREAITKRASLANLEIAA